MYFGYYSGRKTNKQTTLNKQTKTKNKTKKNKTKEYEMKVQQKQ